MLALFLALDNGLRVVGVRALKQFIAAFFGLAIFHAFAAVQLAARPAAELTAFHLDGKLSAMQMDRMALRGLKCERVPIDGYASVLNQQQNMNVTSPRPQDISGLHVLQRNESPLVVDARADIDSRVSANRTHHIIQDASARARSKGPSVPVLLRKAPTTKQHGV